VNAAASYQLMPDNISFTVPHAVLELAGITRTDKGQHFDSMGPERDEERQIAIQAVLIRLLDTNLVCTPLTQPYSY
jgi:hypothetical protein